MTDINEPADGGYVAVQIGSGVQIFHRDDELALASRSQFRWLRVDDCGLDPRNPRSWAEIEALGPIAYVGEFVNRRVQFKGEPWLSM